MIVTTYSVAEAIEDSNNIIKVNSNRKLFEVIPSIKV